MGIRFAKPSFSDEARARIHNAIDDILTSGQLISGESTIKFESAFAELTACKHALSVNSCTTALQIALSHYDVRGCEVLVPAAAFITDASVVSWCGGTPVLVDVDPATLSFDLEDLKAKIGPRTKGIIWVHLTGFISPNWRQIKAIAKENGLFLIEDCAHAHGAVVDGVAAGCIGDVGCFSFYPTKVLTCGTGGMLVTNCDSMARTAREMRMFGRENGTGPVVREGNDWFLDEIRACIGYEQVADLQKFLKRRRAIADRYRANIPSSHLLKHLDVPPNNYPAYYHFFVFLSSKVNQISLSKQLQDNFGIPTKIIYPPLAEENIFLSLDNPSIARTSAFLRQTLCLPMHADLTDDEVDFISKSINEELRD